MRLRSAMRFHSDPQGEAWGAPSVRRFGRDRWLSRIRLTEPTRPRTTARSDSRVWKAGGGGGGGRRGGGPGGPPRRFVFRAVGDPGHRYAYTVRAGDVVDMHGDCQARFQHALLPEKSAADAAPRISLVFKQRRAAPRG